MDPEPQLSLVPVRAAHVLGMNPADVVAHCDLSLAHTSSGYVLDYRVLSLMNPIDVVVLFHLS